MKARSLKYSLLTLALLFVTDKAMAATVTISAPTDFSSFNAADDYVFEDQPATAASTVQSSVPSAVGINSISLGSNTFINFGNRSVTIASGNINFSPTGSTSGFSGIRATGGSLTSGGSVLNVTVTNTGQAQIYSNIVGSNSLVKSGVGKLHLSGNNAYTGGTIVNQGVVAASPGSSLGTGSVTMNSGTLLEAYDVNFSNLTLNNASIGNYRTTVNGGTLTLGASTSNFYFNGGATDSFAFADSSATLWDSTATLKLVGFQMGVDTVRFGTNSNGLTLSQLSKITWASDPLMTFKLDSNGYLISAIPEPTTYAMFGVFAMAFFWIVRKNRLLSQKYI